jgi:putative membrane protein
MARIALVLGLAVMVVLVIREGAQSIVSLLRHAGWLLLLLVPLHAVPLLLDVMGWRVLILERSHISALFLIASIREAINRLLPVANIGGELVGVHLLTRQGISGTAAASSVIVEMLLILVAQYLFLTLGVGCLLHITGTVKTAQALLIAAAGGLPVILLLIWLLRSGMFFRAIKRLASRMLGSNEKTSSVLGRLAPLDTAIRELTSAHGRLARAIAWQLAGLLGGCSETWLALRWLGHPLSLAAALALESFTLAARSLIFVAPAGLGVQEAGLIGVGHVLGLGSDVAVALSLAKRMREILFGLPALAAWQWTIRARA